MGRLPHAQACFRQAMDAMRLRTGTTAFVMACTEIPLALPQPGPACDAVLIDPTTELANALARRAYR